MDEVDKKIEAAKEACFDAYYKIMDALARYVHKICSIPVADSSVCASDEIQFFYTKMRFF